MRLLRLLRLEWDRTLAMVLVVVGAIVLLLGWVGVSSTPFPAAQLPYMVSGGLGGVFLLGVGALLWLSADLRDEWRKLDRIEQQLSAAGGEQTIPSRAVQCPGMAGHGPSDAATEQVDRVDLGRSA